MDPNKEPAKPQEKKGLRRYVQKPLGRIALARSRHAPTGNQPVEVFRQSEPLQSTKVVAPVTEVRYEGTATTSIGAPVNTGESGGAVPSGIPVLRIRGFNLENDKLNPFYDTVRANRQIRSCLAEFLGTLILVAFGCGANAQYTLLRGAGGDYLIVAFGWGLGLTFGIYIAGGVSGAHLNPAVSLVLCIFRRFSWKLLIPYWFAQLLGAFVGAAMVYGLWHSALYDYGAGELYVTGPLATAGIFGTFPAKFLNIGWALLVQVIETAVFLIVILAVTDNKNDPPRMGLVALIIGLSLFTIGIFSGGQSGFPVNPARDFGPRLLAAAVYGKEVFTAHNHYFWVPIVGPFLGALLGALVYDIFIKIHHPAVVAKPID